MSFTVFLGNLPAWVTADDIRGWLAAENLVADAIKVIRNPETQESKGFAFIDAPNSEEMNSIIRRFDRAPLEDRMLRANPAQPPKPKGVVRPGDRPDRPADRPGGYGGPSGAQGGGYGRPHQAHSHSQGVSQGNPQSHSQSNGQEAAHAQASEVSQASTQTVAQTPPVDQRPPRRGKRAGGKKPSGGSSSAFAEELAKAL
jgi:RNA recognition motif-containing protein